MQFQKKLKEKQKKQEKFGISKNLSLGLKASWIPVLGCGFILGIMSQHIQTFRAFTDNIIKNAEVGTTSASHFHTNDEIKHQIVMNQPRSFFHIDRTGYALAYDASRRNPQWVYEYLSADSIQGNANRSHANFREDDNIPTHLRATLIDYKGHGFDRGHMAPAADHRSSEKAMSDTFFMTNMCPQCPELNRGYWSKLEKHVRDLTQQYNSIRVVTGPLYLPYQEPDGKRYVKYQVIGPNNVAVPTHFFKVLSLEKKKGKSLNIAYILPNERIDPNVPIEKFQTTVQKVEQAAGIVFAN